MLDSDLADLYKVETGHLNRAVQRNIERFPNDFMFSLSIQEVANLRCQFGISSLQDIDITDDLSAQKKGSKKQKSHGGRRYYPCAFTEQGVAMLSSVLKSKEAAIVNVHIMRTFVRMREVISAHSELSRKLEQLEYRLDKHDDEIVALFEAIKQLMAPLPVKKKSRLGF